MIDTITRVRCTFRCTWISFFSNILFSLSISLSKLAVRIWIWFVVIVHVPFIDKDKRWMFTHKLRWILQNSFQLQMHSSLLFLFSSLDFYTNILFVCLNYCRSKWKCFAHFLKWIWGDVYIYRCGCVWFCVCVFFFVSVVMCLQILMKMIRIYI